MNPTPNARTSGWQSALVSLQYRDFRLLWLGQFISLLGTQMRIVAVNLQVYQIARDTGALDPALALGTIGLARVIPIVLMALISGLVADTLDRRKLLQWSALASLFFSVVLAVMSHSANPPLWLIYTMVAGAAVAGAFEMPARQAMIPTLVPAHHLPNALSLNVITWQLATVVGPSLAGILIAWLGIASVYWIDAVTFVAVVIAVMLMRIERVAAQSGPPVSIGAAFEGLRFVFRTPLIASTMLLDFWATFFGAAMTLLPLFADQVLGVGTAELGLLYAAPSAGAFLAAVFLTTRQITRQGPVLLWAVVLFGFSTVVFGLSRWFPLTLLALAVSGAADTVSMVIRGTIRQLQTPDELRGRMTAVNMVFFAGGPQLGEFESGLAASLVGAQPAVALGGTLCMILVGLTAWRWPELLRYRGPEPESTR